jgi:hypothetical protein
MEMSVQHGHERVDQIDALFQQIVTSHMRRFRWHNDAYACITWAQMPSLFCSFRFTGAILRSPTYLPTNQQPTTNNQPTNQPTTQICEARELRGHQSRGNLQLPLPCEASPPANQRPSHACMPHLQERNLRENLMPVPSNCCQR